MKTLSIVSLLGAVVLAVAAQDDPQALRPVGSAATIRHTVAVVYEDGEIVNAHFLSDKTVTSSRVASQFVHRLDGGGGPTDPVPPTPGTTLGQATITAFGKITSPKKETWASVYSQIPYAYVRDGLTQGVFGNPPNQIRINAVLDSSFAIASATDDWKTFRTEVSAAMGNEFANKPITATALAAAFDQVAAALKSVSSSPSAAKTTPQIDALWMMAETYQSATAEPIDADEFAMWMQLIQLLLPLILALFGLG